MPTRIRLLLEELHDRGEHLVARQARPREVGPGTTPDVGQRGRKPLHPIELVLVAMHAPRGVIAILLATLGIASGRLQVAARMSSDPHVGPGGRTASAAIRLSLGGIANELSVRTEIGKAASLLVASDSRTLIADVAQPGRRRDNRIGVENTILFAVLSNTAQ